MQLPFWFSAILMKAGAYVLFEKNFCTEITYKRHWGTFQSHFYRFNIGELSMFYKKLQLRGKEENNQGTEFVHYHYIFTFYITWVSLFALQSAGPAK